RSPGRWGRGGRVPGCCRGRGRGRLDAGCVRPEHRGAVTAMTNQLPARPVEQVKDLADAPSFPAVYAAALTPRRGRETSRRNPVLPEVTYRVRSVRIDAERAASFDHLMGGPATELVH